MMNERKLYSILLGIVLLISSVFIYNVVVGSWIGPFAERAQNNEIMYVGSLAKLPIVNQSEIIDYTKTNKPFGARSMEVIVINEQANFLSEISEQLQAEGWKAVGDEKEGYSTYQKEHAQFIVKKIGANKYSILIE